MYYHLDYNELDFEDFLTGTEDFVFVENDCNYEKVPCTKDCCECWVPGSGYYDSECYVRTKQAGINLTIGEDS